MHCDVYLKTDLSDGASCAIIVRAGTVKRLSTTCFRGKGRPFAGNFAIWESFREMLEGDFVLRSITDDILRVIEGENDQPDGRSRRLQVQYPTDVGWSSTTRCIDNEERPHSWWAPTDEVFDHELVEPFFPNRKSEAFRVRLDRTDVTASLDYYFTIVYELKFEHGRGWVAVVHTVYPGEDVGELRGNITERKGVVFFDFQHPGQSLDQSDTLRAP